MDPRPTGIADRRPFHLIDAITLIAAAAIMLTAERSVNWIWSAFSAWFGDVPSWDGWEIRRMARSLALAELSLVLLLPILATSRQRGRLRSGSPGLFVHLAVGTVVVVRLAGWLSQESLYRLLAGRPGVYPTRWTVEVLDYLRDDLRRDATIAILAGWLALAAVGRWGPRRAWDDRLGRLVGLLWVAYYLGIPLVALLP